MTGLLSTGQAASLIELSRQLCADLAPQSLALVEAFGLPEDLLRSPIGKVDQTFLQNNLLILVITSKIQIFLFFKVSVVSRDFKSFLVEKNSLGPK